MRIKPVILCGGAGTRLWPQSKKNIPKQFIDWGGWNLFGKTLERIKSPLFDYPIITTNFAYINLVKKYLSKYKIKKYKIISEPFKKNTASAILSSALLKEVPYGQPMIFFPTDNLVGKIKQFNKSINFYKKYLDNNNIFIFGIKPTEPSSEYGYFLTRKNSNKLNVVYKFIEKPNKQMAKKILKKNGYMNSGMFFAKKESIIRNFAKHQYKIFKNCNDAVYNSNLYKNVYYLKKSPFKKLKEISFDYAILEKTKNINGIKLNIPLTDLGNWKEIWKFFKKSLSKKDIKKNTYYKPWGKYINLFSGKGFLLKELIINPKSSLSLQKHNYRSERWTIISGNPKITIDRNRFFANPNEAVYIPKKSIHRIENKFTKPVQIVEAQIGVILKESDITRYKDIYGRAS